MPTAGAKNPCARAPSTTEGRLIVASNRLPVSLRLEASSIHAQPSAGGLQSALSGLQRGEGFVWVGWPGCAIPAARHAEVERQLGQSGWVPVFLGPDQEEHYYHGISNGALWPLFHYFTDRVEFRAESWAEYVAANEAFARAILAVARPGDRVWVHDFHLMLVPRMLRQQAPELEIGFFLHIPFPSSEIYRLFPEREELLLGVLGADYVGFHTQDYARHFRSACLRVLGLETDLEGIELHARRVGVGVHPIGIEVERFRELMQSPPTRQLLKELEERYAGRRLILGIERLDYTKGVPNKLAAFETFLRRDPARALDVTMLQVLVPSRLENPEYAALKREIEEQVGRLNGEYGRPGVTPVQYMHRNLSPEQLVALYMFADVGYVAPLRDGMNLVAQEFVLCQQSDKGALVLSELAGAAHSLSGALLVNPYDVERSADTLELALAMSAEERRERMRPMAERVAAMDSQRWARTCLHRQQRAAERNRAATPRTALHPEERQGVIAAFAAAARGVFLLDYDGTLREFTKTPEEARPTQEILDLLAQLAALPGAEVHIVSGRKSETLQAWFGHLDLALAAEHGGLVRERGAWRPLARVDLSWMPRVRAQLEALAEEVPGSFVEPKSMAIAWHYRRADPDYGAWRARELVSHLQEDLGGGHEVQVIHGHKVVEARAFGVDKGAYVRQALQGTGPETFVLCIGDDRTDQDMYDALPPHAVAIHVGARADRVMHTLESPESVRALLREIVGAERAVEGAAAASTPNTRGLARASP